LQVDSEKVQLTECRARKPPFGLGELARRITSRTTDLIAISIVLVASLTLGRQALVWWHADPGEKSITAALPGPDLGQESVSLEFGDLPLAMTRDVVAGDQKEAVDALVRRCQRETQAMERPWRERDKAEERLLEMTSALSPVAEEAGVWQVFVLDERFTLVAGVRSFLQPPGQTDGGRRLVCWGLAMPAGEKHWNLYTFQASQQPIASIAGPGELPLPPEARRNLSLRDERGGQLIGFSGGGSPRDWMTFYDDWFAERGWSAPGGWSAGDLAWSARFQKSDGSEAGRIDVRFASERSGGLTGLLQVQAGVSIFSNEFERGRE